MSQLQHILIRKTTDKTLAVTHQLSKIAVIIACIALAGCTSSEKFYEEVRLSRNEAVRQWNSRREAQKQSETMITGKLGIQDCLTLTIVNNKTLQSILQEKEIAKGEVLKSYSAILPSVSFSGDYTRLDEVTSFEVAGKTVSFGDPDNYSTALTVNQPIFAGGSIIARLNAGQLYSLLTDQNIRQATHNAIYLASRAYYDVLLDQHLYQISADAVRSAKAHLDDVKQKKQGGVASDFDVLRADVELSNFQAELIQNKNAINIAKTNLFKVMGVSQDSNVTLSDELIYSPLEMTMEQAVATAFRKRPDLLGKQFDIKLQNELLNISKSRYWPTVSGFYTNIWSKPDPHRSMDIEWGHAWQSGIMITMPLFDGFAREGEIIQQKARTRQAQIDLIDTEETALYALTRALLSIENSQEFVQSQQLNLARAEEGSRLASVGYREGINTQVEVIDAESALTRAKSFYYQAIYTHIIAKLDLQKAMGTLGPQPIDVPATEKTCHAEGTQDIKTPATETTLMETGSLKELNILEGEK